MEPQQPVKQRWSRRVTLFVVIGVLVGLVAAVAVAGSFRPVCSQCHRAQTTALASTSHAGVGCYQCHLQNGVWSVPGEKANELLGMYPRAIIAAGYRGPASQTSRAACVACHKEILKGVSTRDGLRIQHSTCATGSSCDSCHTKVGHPGETRWVGAPVMEDCVACHRQENASTECSTCHVETENRSVRARGPWQVTHGRDWQKMHGMGQIDSCSTCHLPGFCAKCHNVPVPHPVEFGSTHGELAMKDPATCETCHKTRSFCNACHGTPMPHPASFLKSHSTTSRGTQDPACLRCHDATDCDNCHANHVHPGGSKGVPVPWTYTQGQSGTRTVSP